MATAPASASRRLAGPEGLAGAGAEAPPIAAGILALLAAAKIAIHLPAMTRYGYFRDELYYLASTDHLAFGFVDHPPLSIAVLWAVRAILGDSLPALRLIPLLCGVAMVLLCALTAREMGGGRWAQGMAGLAALVTPVYMAIHHYYSMNALDHLAWGCAIWLLARLIRTGEARLWIPLGIVLGLGLNNKISVLWLGAGTAAGLVLTPHRRWLSSRWPWAAAGIAAALFGPHLAWQAAHGWPTLEFMRNAAERKMVEVGLGDFLAGQILTMNPFTAPLWIAGLVWCLWPSGAGRPWRLLAIAWLAAFVLLAGAGTSRSSYLAPAYPMILAAGSVALSRWAAARRAGRRAAAIYAPALSLSGILIAPFALPVLSPDTFIAYMKASGIAPRGEERSARADLPQQYADMFGWDEMAETVARVYHALPEEDRRRCGIFAQNYGEAGAIDVLGRKLGLPPAMSGHNSYWMWGPPEEGLDVVIVMGGDLEDNQEAFESLELAATVRCPRCMPYERDLPVYVGRRLRAPIHELWPRLKEFI